MWPTPDSYFDLNCVDDVDKRSAEKLAPCECIVRLQHLCMTLTENERPCQRSNHSADLSEVGLLIDAATTIQE